MTFDVVDDLAAEFAERVVEAFHYRDGELFHLGLTGGACARRCYEQLARHGETQIDWWRVDTWWVDEADVPPDHPDSHYGMARAVLFDAVGAAYALHPLLSPAGEAPDELPGRLDVVHLDLRPDGSLLGARRLPTAVLARARTAVITASGIECREAVKALRQGRQDPVNLVPCAQQMWLVERDAAN